MGTLCFIENVNWGKRLGIIVWHYLAKLKLNMLCDLAILHLGIYSSYKTQRK